jgi:hypothetical protein
MFSCLSIACSNVWLEVYLKIKKVGTNAKPKTNEPKQSEECVNP